MSPPHPPPPATASTIAPTATAETSASSTAPLPSSTPPLSPPVSVFGDLARSSLVELLNSVQGAKTLVLDAGVSGPLGLVTDISLLKHQAVDKLFWLEPGPLAAAGLAKNIVWLCHPKRTYMQIIADQIKSLQQVSPNNTQYTFTLILVPRCTEVCRRTLEEEGVAGDIRVLEWKLELIPLDEDVLSMEATHVARDIWLNGDDTPIWYASEALMTLQRAYGLFPRIMGKGDAAKRLTNLLAKHRHSQPSLYADLEPSTTIDGLIVLDRAVDWVTPMCTQLTYEGLIDEFVGVKNGHVEVDAELVAPPNIGQRDQQSNSATAAVGSSLATPPQPKKKKHRLTSSTDRLFSELRDLNFAVVGARLSRTARRLEEGYDTRHKLGSVKEMRDFVGKLGGLQSEHQGLRLHTGLSELLMPITRSDEFNKTLEIQQNLIAGYDVADQMNAIEDLLNQQAPMSTVLRAAVLYSITAGGIKQKVLDNFKRDFLQVYGYHHLPLFMALSDMDLLTKSPSRNTTFPSLRKALRLLVDDIDEQHPTDISYVYSGYAPLSIRLIQCIAQKPVVLSNAVKTTDANGVQVVPKAHPLVGWRGFEDVVKAIPGATIDEVQTTENVADGSVARPMRDAMSTTVVFFLGGCTYTEIAALRWMNSQMKGRRFLIATTGIINGSSLLTDLGLPNPVELKPTTAS